MEKQDLIDALKFVQYALACFRDNEPIIHPDLLKQDNVVVLPHIGSATYETRSQMAIMAAQNLLDGMQGKKPQNCVNPEIFI